MHAQILARTDVVGRKLDRWAKNAGIMEPTMLEVSGYIEEAERNLFASQGATGGKPWAPDAPETDISKARLGYSNNQTLVASGDLRNSLTDSQDTNAIREVGPGTLRFGSKLPYAEPIHKGYTKGSQDVPARRLIQLNGRDRYAILKIIKSGLVRKSTASVAPSIRSLRGLSL